VIVEAEKFHNGLSINWRPREAVAWLSPHPKVLKPGKSIV
jgi:hypothetical protein